VTSDGSFEFQFLIDNAVYRYFKFTLSAMSIILQCRYFVSVLDVTCPLHVTAKRGFAIACRPYMCASVRPSVTFVDQDHIGCKSWKLIARTITPTPSLLVAQRPSTYFQGNVGKSEETIGESLGKVVCRSTKAAISLKRVKIEEK